MNKLTDVENKGKQLGFYGHKEVAPWASPVAQMIKNLPEMKETWEDPPEKGMAAHSNIRAWRIPMGREDWQGSVHGVSKSWT